MVINGASRRSVGFWIKHLQNDTKNDRAELREVRGLAADNLEDALYEMKDDARLTRCQNFMYHANFNPCPHERLSEKDWERAFEIFEKHRGIPPGQARVVYEHEKEGRIHRHVIWSRIDLENMRAWPDALDAKICHAASREISEELGLERSASPFDKDREGPRPKRAPKSYEMFRGMKSGIDPRDVTAEVTAIFRESEHGADFVEGLRQHGYQFVQGDRAFCILDSAGNEHSLARRLDGVNTKELRAFMQGVDLGPLPTVEQAKAQYQERKIAQLQADRATVQHEIEWEEALAKAAIEKEKIERRFVEPGLEAGKQEGRREKQASTPEHSKPAAPELGRTPGEIRLARSLTQSPQGFANALEDRGLILARVTATDMPKLAELEREWQKANPSKPQRAARQAWMTHRGGADELSPEHLDSAKRSYENWDPKYKARHSFENYVAYVQKRDEERRQGQGRPETSRFREGDLAVVNQYGDVYALTTRNTGLNREERQEYMKAIDPAPLLSVSDARRVMGDVYQQRRMEKQWGANEKHWPVNPPQPAPLLGSPEYHFRDAGREAAWTWHPGMPEDLKGAAAQIWTAWHHSDNAKAFVAALQENGIHLAVVTEEEARRSHINSSFAKEVERFSPKYRTGEIVAVVEPGLVYGKDGNLPDPPVYRIDRRTTGESQAGIDKFLKPLDRSQMQGIAATKESLIARAEEGIAEVQAFRDILRDTRNAERLKRAQEPGKKPAPTTRRAYARGIFETVVGAAKTTGQVIEAGFDAGANLAGAAISFFDPPTTPAQREQAAENSRDEREVQGQRQIDWSNYTADAAQNRQNQQEQQAGRDRQREAERDRD